MWDKDDSSRNTILAIIAVIGIFGLLIALFTYEPKTTHPPTYRERQEAAKAKENAEWRSKVCEHFGCYK
jgi:hypothetical protein